MTMIMMMTTTTTMMIMTDNDDKYIDLATAKNEALLVKEGLFFYPT